MFNFLKKLFMKKEKIYTLSNNIFDNKNILCYEDLYKATNIMEDIKIMLKQNKFNKYHYQNIQANSNTIMKCNKLIHFNLIKTKNKYSRNYTEHYLKNMAAMDSLLWAPKTNNKLKDNCILVLLPNHKNFINVTKGML